MIAGPCAVENYETMDTVAKYVKAGDGYYEKRAGKGPDVLHKDSPIDASDV